MPPKRAKKAPPAPTRRSARIQSRESSREPSLEIETLSAVPSLPAQPAANLIASPPSRSPSPPLTAVVKKTPNKPYTAVRREFTLAKIRQENLERQREEEAAKIRALATPPKQLPSPPSPEHAAPPATAPQPRAAPEQQAAGGWRTIISSLSGYFASPFVRKRPVEEDETPTLANKRTRLQEPKGGSSEDAEFGSPIAGPSRKRQSAEESAEYPGSFPKLQQAVIEKPTTKRKRADDQVESSSADNDFTVATSYMASTPEAAITALGKPIEEGAPLQDGHAIPVPQLRPVMTPHSARDRKSPSPRACPSSKRPEEPTSLSTITEHSEPSFFSNLSQIDETSPTPSKPPRVQPPSNTLAISQSAPKQPVAAPQARQPTPRRNPMGTPLMRRAAQLRAAREAEQTGTPNTSNFSFSTAKRPPPSKPRETNADARRAKLERMRELQKELEELQNDEDVQEMQSHRRKRVKIDNLVSIPHNLPGDPSGMFRVPEGDSDDEMEVYDDVEERSNVFEDSERMVQDMEVAPPKAQAVKDVPASTKAVNKSSGAQTQAVKDVPAPRIPPPTLAAQHPPPIEFHFPEVGPIPAGYYTSDAYREEARMIFEEGLAKFLAT